LIKRHNRSVERISGARFLFHHPIFQKQFGQPEDLQQSCYSGYTVRLWISSGLASAWCNWRKSFKSLRSG